MISDEDLLLYHYRELDGVERARISAALAAQPELAQRLHRLVAKLDAAAAIPEVPVPDAVQRRWEKALDEASRDHSRRASASTPRRTTAPRWLAAAAAIAIVGFVVMFQVMQQPTPELAGNLPETAPLSDTIDASAYEKGLKVHLASTERRLASLENASPDERARLVDTIIAQNRLYALAAERAGEPQLARVLRAFTPILEDLASDGGEATEASVAQLGFELRVMQARLGAGAHTNTL